MAEDNEFEDRTDLLWAAAVDALREGEEFFDSHEFLAFFVQQSPSVKQRLSKMRSKIAEYADLAATVELEFLLAELQQQHEILEAAIKDLKEALEDLNNTVKILNNIATVAKIVRGLLGFFLF